VRWYGVDYIRFISMCTKYTVCNMLDPFLCVQNTLCAICSIRFRVCRIHCVQFTHPKKCEQIVVCADYSMSVCRLPTPDSPLCENLGMGGQNVTAKSEATRSTDCVGGKMVDQWSDRSGPDMWPRIKTTLILTTDRILNSREVPNSEERVESTTVSLATKDTFHAIRKLV